MSEHYFTSAPDSVFHRFPVEARVWGQSMSLVSGTGVFSRGRVDTGTGVLVSHTGGPGAHVRRVLDLGTGYGIIACAVGLVVPAAHVWAVDVNERALLLTAENAASLGLSDRVTATLPDAVPADVTFDEIWSNPPIRIGKPALRELLLRWLPRLEPTGRAVMVVGRNLGADSLQRWLQAQGYGCERTASAKGYRILQVRGPVPVAAPVSRRC